MIEMYRIIWQVSWRRQLVLIALALSIAALAAAPLEFQKNIINELTDGHLALDQLLLMGAGMLGVILLSLLLKWQLGYRSGKLGEDIIRVLRVRLYTDMISRPAGSGPPAGTLTTAISAEAEELGKFTGGAFSDPVVQVGTLFSVISYIGATQPGLGAIALMMIVPQILIVLMTQQQVNRFVEERVRLLRGATDQILRSDMKQAERDVLDKFDEIFETRRRMFMWKLSAKFVVSAINGIGTVGVLMLGGWLVTQGKTDVGTVVAATLGLGRLQAPTSFLIAFYRQVSATRVKFELLRELIIARGAGAPAVPR